MNIFKTIKLIFNVTLLLSGSLILADEKLVIEESPASSGWSLSLGTTFRSINKIELHGVNSPVGSYFNGANTGVVVTVDNFLEQTTALPAIGHLPIPFATHYAVLSKAAFSGSDEDISTTGLVLGASKVISEYDKGTFNLDLSMIFLSETNSYSYGSGAVADGFYIQNFTIAGIGGSGDLNAIQPAPGSDIPDQSMIKEVSLDFDVELNVWTFGFGGSQTFTNKDGWSLKYGGGPTVTIVDYELEGASVRPDGKLGRTSDNGLDLLFGIYAAVDLSYAFDPNWSLGAGVRYDWIQELSNSVADVDLSGMSVELKAIYSF